MQKSGSKPMLYGSNPLLSVIFILISIFVIELFVNHFVIERFHSKDVLFNLLLKAALMIPMLYFFVCRPISHYIGQLVETKKQLELANIKLAESRDFYLTLFDDFPAMIWRSGLDGKCNYFNKEWLGFRGKTIEEEAELGWANGIYSEDADKCVQSYLDSFKARDSFLLEFRLQRYDGEYRWISGYGRAYCDLDGKFAGFIVSCFDITVRKELEDKAWYQALHDPLTGLPNRKLFMDRLNLALAHNTRHSKMLALMFLDMDQFKKINDMQGHDTGDKVLIEFARKLNKCLREEDTVARMGGDEFMVLLPEINNKRDASIVAERILEVFGKPLLINKGCLTVTPSIGISIYPLDGKNADALIKEADAAMYKAKVEGLGFSFAQDVCPASR